jgi:putative flippase GtrA
MISTQVIKFLTVGIICTILNYICFLIFLRFLGVNFLLASSCGYIIGLLFGYSLNRAWTFQSIENSLTHKFKYLFTYLFSLAVGLIFLQILVKNYGVATEIANICVILITTLLNFLGTKFWVFGK